MMTQNPLTSEVEITIPFHDVDSIHIVWHGHYYKYFEIARTEILRQLDYDVPQMVESGIGWPVIETKCRYIQPLTYGMQVRVVATVTEYVHRLKVSYVIYNVENEMRMAKGYTIQAAVNVKTGQIQDTDFLQERIESVTSQKGF